MFQYLWRYRQRCTALLGCLILLMSVGCSSGGDCTQNSDCKASEVCTNQKCTETSGCKADTDCKANQTCDNGACKDNVAVGCKADTDCKDGETCKDGKCGKQEGGCKVDTDCKKGEVCLAQKVCVKKFVPCTKNGDCDLTEICAEVSTGKTACLLKCDPTANESDNSNKGCWNGWGSCLRLFEANPTLGACIPPQVKNRKKGEACGNIEDFTKPEYNECLPALNCVRGKCAPNCKESEGTSSNPNCEKGFFCKETDGRGKCESLPKKETGGRVGGQTCSKARTCDGDKGFFCHQNFCISACDPRDGKDSNPSCKKDESCRELPETSYRGGGCTATPTQKQDEACDARTLLCLDGFTCFSGRCQKTCAQASDCEKDEACGNTSKVCVSKCDPTKGPAGGNTACRLGYACQGSTTVPPGYCRALPTFKEGKLKAGEACSGLPNGGSCDGSQKFYCSLQVCRKACDQRKGTDSNSDCKANEECNNSTTSPLGGVCLPKGTQKEGEACDTTTIRCIASLTCRSARCQRVCVWKEGSPQGDCKAEEWCYRTGQTSGYCIGKCDPAKDVVGNASCPNEYYCAESQNTYKPGFCRTLPIVKQGPIKEGEDCSNIDSTKFCDGKSGLTCYNRKCTKACNPKDGTTTNTACGTGECQLNTQQSHLGGICIAAASQKENEECTTAKRCLKDLLCISLGTKNYCLKTCDPKNSNCPTGSTCDTVPRTQNSYCVAARKKTRKVGEVCQSTPGTPTYDDCVADHVCVGNNGADAHCLRTCTRTGGTPCPTGYSCTLVGRSRACTQDCKTDADCKDYGGICRTFGQSSFCY